MSIETMNQGIERNHLSETCDICGAVAGENHHTDLHRLGSETVESTSDERTVNNTLRHKYRILTDIEKEQMLGIKNRGLELHEYIDLIGNSRELSLAKTKLEEAVMWAVKHVTG